MGVLKLDQSGFDELAQVVDSEPVVMRGGRQLFVDDHLIAFKTGVHRRINRPEKQTEPILVAEQPWEGQSILYSCVMPMEDEYWLYYKAKNWSPEENSPYSSTTINLAKSADAIAFEKQSFPESVFEGSNVVLNDAIDDYTIFHDINDPDPNRRFKLLSSRGNWREGLTPATSADGLQWVWGSQNAVRYFGDRMSYWYDPIREKHVAWSRNLKVHPKRIVVESLSEDFETWSYPRIAMMPNELDHPDSQIYGAYGFWYESVYLAYVEIYEVAHQRLHTQLASSRDGERWTRLCEHDVFLPCGEHGAFDAYWIVPTFNPPIISGDQLLIHYGGRPDPHKAAGFDHVRPGMGGALGLSTLRLDGFVSLDATGRYGVVQTHPLKLEGTARFLNVNVCPFNQRTGYDAMDVEVEVRCGDLVDVCKIERDLDDSVCYRIDLGKSISDIVRLAFRLKNARLYSFEFTD